jgi:hypothetical protein
MPRGSRAHRMDAPRSCDGGGRPPVVHRRIRGRQIDAGLPRRIRSRAALESAGVDIADDIALGKAGPGPGVRGSERLRNGTREPLVNLAVSLEISLGQVRRDDCARGAIIGRSGHVYALPVGVARSRLPSPSPPGEGNTIMVTPSLRIASRWMRSRPFCGAGPSLSLIGISRPIPRRIGEGRRRMGGQCERRRGRGGVRIPTKPATNSNRKPATHSDPKPATTDLKPATQRSLPRIERMMFRRRGSVKQMWILGLRRATRMGR